MTALKDLLLKNSHSNLVTNKIVVSTKVKHKKVKTLKLPQLCLCNCKQFTKPGNRFIYGHNIRQLNLIRKGRKLSEEIKAKIGAASKGRKLSEESKAKRRGRKHSEVTLLKMRLIKLGDNNLVWKGEDVGNGALHAWVRRHLPMPELCQMCNLVPPYDLANITGIYNRDFSNWKYLCRHCHMTSDGRLIQFINSPRNTKRVSGSN